MYREIDVICSFAANRSRILTIISIYTYQHLYLSFRFRKSNNLVGNSAVYNSSSNGNSGGKIFCKNILTFLSSTGAGYSMRRNCWQRISQELQLSDRERDVLSTYGDHFYDRHFHPPSQLFGVSFKRIYFI